MNDPRHAERHDEDLSALYRTTRDPEPPVWLDRRILMAAEAAASPSSSSAAPLARRRRIRLWTMPAALAATVVLAVGIVRLARETGEEGSPPESKTLQAPAESTAEADAAAGRARARAEERAAPPAASLRPALPRGEAVRVAPQPAPALPAAPPPVGGERRSLRLQAAPAERERQEVLQVEPERRAGEDAALRDQPDRRAPEAWLAAIAELRRQGRTAEADASLAEFRRRYPDYPLEIAPESPR